MLADPTRVQVLWALVDRELSVNELAEFVGKPAPSVSQHLAKLRMARLVAPAGRAPRSTTASRTSTSDNWSTTPSSTPSTPGPGVPAHHRGDVQPSDVRPVDDESHTLVPHSHDAADSVDSALESSAIGIRAVKISLVALGVTALAQAVIVVFSGSVALAADTIHNFSDALTAVPLWIAFALGTPGGDPALHLRLRPRRRSRRALRRRDDRPVGGRRRIRGRACGSFTRYRSSTWAGWRAAGLIGFVGNELVALYRIRIRPPNRFCRTGCRRSARPHRRLHVVGGVC